MRKNQYQNDEEMIDSNIDIKSTKINPISNTKSTSNNPYKIKSCYNINQIIKGQKASLLKIKVNPQVANEFALLNSNFEINYMTIGEDSIYQLSSYKEHTQRINDLCFFKNTESPFDKAFITASSDGTMKIWDSRAQQSVKTIQTIKNAKVYSLDTNENVLVGGFGREIGVWDLKMMKNTNRCKFGHSEDCTTLKLRGNMLISGGEDNIVNVFDITNGLNMDSVVSQANIGQSLSSVNFLDEECRYIAASTCVFTFSIFDMWSGVSIFNFDAKSEEYNSEYILESFYKKEENLIQIFCGNNLGHIISFNLNFVDNKGDVQFDTLIKTGINQSFNSVDKIPGSENYYIVVSDEGILFLIDKVNGTKTILNGKDMID